MQKWMQYMGNQYDRRDGEMNWTKQKPIVEGWYFWRSSGRCNDSLHWDVIFIEPDIERDYKGQWAGPIEEPHDKL